MRWKVSLLLQGTIKVGGVRLLWIVVLLPANMVFQASAESCSTSQKFAATQGCGSNNYIDQCSTSFDDNNSCECSSYPNFSTSVPVNALDRLSRKTA